MRATPSQQADFSAVRSEVTNITPAMEAARNLPPEAQRAVADISASMQADNPPLEITYQSVRTEGTQAAPEGRTARRAEQEAAYIQEGLGAAPESIREAFQKVLVPVRWEIVGDKPQLIAMSLDKVIANVHRSVRDAVDKGAGPVIPYEIVDGKLTDNSWGQIVDDVQAYTENQSNGYRGDGEGLIRPTEDIGVSIPMENPGYTPVRISPERANFVNMVMGIAPPQTARQVGKGIPGNVKGQVLAELQGRRPETPAKIGDIAKQEFKPMEIPGRPGPETFTVKETNPLRNELARRDVPVRELIEVTERIKPEEITSVTPRPDIQFSAPVTDVVRAGFQPKTMEQRGQFQPKTEKGREVESRGYSFERVRDGLKQRVNVRIGDNLAGFISVNQKGRSGAEISMVWVGDKFRKQGLGEALYREMLTDLKDSGITQLEGRLISEAPLRMREKLFGGEFDTIEILGEAKKPASFGGLDIVSDYFTSRREDAPAAGKKVSVEEALKYLGRKDRAAGTGVRTINKLSPEMKFQPKTEMGKALEEKGYTFLQGGSPAQRSVWVRYDGKTIGEIETRRISPERAEISMVRVNEKFRKRGLGEGLYREVLTDLQNDGVTEVEGMIVGVGALKTRAKVFENKFEALEGLEFDQPSRIQTISRRAEAILNVGEKFSARELEQLGLPESMADRRLTFDEAHDLAAKEYDRGEMSSGIPRLSQMDIQQAIDRITEQKGKGWSGVFAVNRIEPGMKFQPSFVDAKTWRGLDEMQKGQINRKGTVPRFWINAKTGEYLPASVLGGHEETALAYLKKKIGYEEQVGAEHDAVYTAMYNMGFLRGVRDDGMKTIMLDGAAPLGSTARRALDEMSWTSEYPVTLNDRPVKGVGFEKGAETGMFQPAANAGSPSRAEVAKAKKAWDELGTDSPYFQRWFGNSKVVESDGNPMLLYHGTTQDFTVMDPARTNVENDYGQGVYTTNSRVDAEINYRGIGPDLEMRIGIEAERLMQEAADEGKQMEYSEAKDLAKSKLIGPVRRNMGVYASLENPVIIGKPNGVHTLPETVLDYVGDGSGLGEQFLTKLRQRIDDVYPYSEKTKLGRQRIENYLTEIEDKVISGTARVSTVINDSKKALWESMESFGAGDVLRQIFQEMGFDGIIDRDVPRKFKAMTGVTGDTMHVVGFEGGNQFKAVEGLPGITKTFTDVADLRFQPRNKAEEGRMALQPRANEAIRNLAEQYSKTAGIAYKPEQKYAQINEALSKRLADFYDRAVHNPDDEAVKASYDALAKETIDQYLAIEAAGYKMEPFEGEGEPYKNSAEAIRDVVENKHLYYLQTGKAFAAGIDSPPTSNLMLQDSGIEGKPVNDIFRAVHDFFGHAKEGYQFGPRGEFNAWQAHSRMYSDLAQNALASETLAQNSWVNFGPQLRTPEGAVPKMGEPGFVPQAERTFAEQKNVRVPEDLMFEARGQFQPKKAAKGKKEEKIRRDAQGIPLKKDGTIDIARWQQEENQRREAQAKEIEAQTDYSKYETKPEPNKAAMASKKPTGWVLPNGEFVGMENEFHEQYLAQNAAELNKRFGTDFSTTPSLAERLKALNKGFVRVRALPGKGEWHIEANAAFWPKQRGIIRNMLTDREDQIDRLFLNVLDKQGQIVDSTQRSLVGIDDPAERVDALMNAVGEVRTRGAFQPKPEGKADLFGKAVIGPSIEREIASKRKTVTENFPEARPPRYMRDENGSLVLDPNGKPRPIVEEYTFMDTPLAKSAGKGLRGDAREEAIATAAADKLIEEARKAQENPEIKAGEVWYSLARELLQSTFGEDVKLFAELLGATSARTAVDVNFGFALDAYNQFRDGAYDALLQKYNEGKRAFESGDLETFRAENKNNENPTRGQFMDWWVEKNDLLPRQSSGKKFGMNSRPVLKVLDGTWLQEVKGPKTPNFTGNLVGSTFEATIDVWAARMLHRKMNEGNTMRWRILPENETGVSDADFFFGQKVFRKAADQLKMQPDSLQALLWFAEKQYWAEKGWSRMGTAAEAKSDFNVLLKRLERVEEGGKSKLRMKPETGPQSEFKLE